MFKSRITGLVIMTIIVAAAYAITLSPSVNLIDSGELALVCKTLGIAHPTGYPLYTLTGRIFCLLNINPPVLNTNIFSLILSLLSLVAFYFLICEVLRLFSAKRDARNRILALGGSLILAFSQTFWQISVTTEVYALSSFLFITLCAILLNWKRTGEIRHLILFFFLWGLAFGNHLNIILCTPAFLFLILSTDITLIKKPWLLISLALFLLAGLSIYLYLPLRSAHEPFMNWGNPQNWENFFRHVSGWQYRVWMFNQPIKELLNRLGNYFILLKNQFTLILLPFALLGFIYNCLKKLKLFLFLILIFVSNIIYSLNYDIPDIDPYFIPSFIVVVIWLCLGVYFISSWFKNNLIALLSVILALFPIYSNYRPNQHRHNLVGELSVNILESAAPRSTIIMDNWDYYSPSLYKQQLEGLRGDLLLIDFELMRRSWYIKHLLAYYPERFKISSRQMNSFLKALEPFEKGEKYNAIDLQKKFHDMVNSIVLENFNNTVYTTFKSKEGLFQEMVKIPEGLLYRLSDDSLYYPFPLEKFRLKEFKDQSYYRDDRIRSVLSIYPKMLGERASYLYKLKKLNRARSYLELTLQFDPENLISLQNLGVINVELGLYKEAYRVFQRIAELYPEKREGIGLILEDLRKKQQNIQP
ncbi:DUF2723 domain-containing protein [bacterium]|nr:DUF2723 domain-containing protein [bacterium]